MATARRTGGHIPRIPRAWSQKNNVALGAASSGARSVPVTHSDPLDGSILPLCPLSQEPTFRSISAQMWHKSSHFNLLIAPFTLAQVSALPFSRTPTGLSLLSVYSCSALPRALSRGPLVLSQLLPTSIRGSSRWRAASPGPAHYSSAPPPTLVAPSPWSPPDGSAGCPFHTFQGPCSCFSPGLPHLLTCLRCSSGVLT